MPERPLPNPATVAQGIDWAQKKIIEANSGRYTEHVYQAYNSLVDIFLVRREQVALKIAEEGGIDHMSGYGSRNNGIICKNGLFIPASEVLSVELINETVDLPPNSPHGISMNRRLTVWFG